MNNENDYKVLSIRLKIFGSDQPESNKTTFYKQFFKNDRQNSKPKIVPKNCKSNDDKHDHRKLLVRTEEHSLVSTNTQSLINS